jgi:Rrf2 family protein
MLKLTRKIEYALIALRHMQGKERGAVTSTKEIAAAYDIPIQLLAKTLQQMAREGIIDPVQGPRGGYRLNERLEQLNLTEFIEMLEGPLGLMDCYFDSNCDQLEVCNIRMPIVKINDTLRTMFDNLSLAELTK